jgi:predicted small lipoprotein YifL
MNITRLTLLSIAAALALSGCGNKGPLVLPDAPDEAEAPAAAEQGTQPAADDAEPASEPADEDAPVEPEPLPQDDGDSD